MITGLSLWEWTRLLAALALFLGPGYGLLSYYPDRRRFDRTQTVALSAGLSIALWSILLAWLYALRIALTPLAALLVLGGGWLIGWVQMRRQERATPSEGGAGARPDASRIVLWGTLLLTAAVGLWAIKGLVAGAGSDSYHHTLISQLIVDRGILPDDFAPYAPLVTFSYHYGFHGLVAALAWVTGLEPLVLVPLLGQILMAVAALSVAYFTEVTTGSRRAATAGAAVAGLVSAFPAYLVNWGRYPQLTGMVLLPLFLGLVWQWTETDGRRHLALVVTILAAGLALANYKVTLMAMSGAIFLVGSSNLARRVSWLSWGRTVGRLSLAAAMAGILVAPWVWHVLNARQQGFPAQLGPVSLLWWSLERLAPPLLNYPTNAAVIGLALFACVLGWWRRQALIVGLSTWSAVVLLLSGPRFGRFYDTISVIVSLYFPAAAAIGWAWVTAVDQLAARWQVIRWLAWLGLAGLTLRGALAVGSILEPGQAMVRYDDLAAMEWIRSNTPQSAYFMVNMYHWDFQPRWVMGSDAGYWLPLLTGRRGAAPPMMYNYERSGLPDFDDRLVALERLEGHLTSPEALALLRREGITHVYVGERGGPILIDDLLNSPAFRLEYQHGSAYVFGLVETR